MLLQASLRPKLIYVVPLAPSSLKAPSSPGKNSLNS